MMSTGHAASGILVGACTAQVTGLTVSDLGWWGWVGVIAGCSLLPDVDLRQSTASELFGPFTRGIRWGNTTLVPGLWSLLRPFLGGHRKRTHSIPGIAVFLAAIWVLCHWLLSSSIVVVFAFGLAVRALFLIATYLFDVKYRKRYWLPLFAGSLAVGWWFYTGAAPLPGWLPWAMAGGCAVHLIGDAMTDSGVQLTHLSEKKFHLFGETLAFKAGGWVEHTLVLPPMLIAAVLVVAYQAGYDPIGSVLTALEGA